MVINTYHTLFFFNKQLTPLILKLFKYFHYAQIAKSFISLNSIQVV